jgi:hypothetical protein
MLNEDESNNQEEDEWTNSTSNSNMPFVFGFVHPQRILLAAIGHTLETSLALPLP